MTRDLVDVTGAEGAIAIRVGAGITGVPDRVAPDRSQS